MTPGAEPVSRRLVVALLVAALVLILPLSLLIGRGSGGGSFGLGSGELAATILREIRLPRTLLGALVGGTLGLCGAGLQGLMRNPLAEPGILGVSSGAAFGAVIVFYFGLASSDSLLLASGAVAGSLAALAILYGLAGRSVDLVRLILAGVGINALAAALTSLALNFAPSPYAALEILFWMFGSLADRSMAHVWLMLPLAVPGWLLVVAAARGLDALILGEDTAVSLGFSVKRTLWLVIGGTALAVGAAVAVTGVVAFVGLVVPHLLRPWVGYRPSQLLGPSFVAGALITVAADIAIRLMPPGPELKLGVVTALIGAPFFLHLVLKSRGRLSS
ncbi:MAG TPA: iron ABC transporter permease [Gammaproteobacteria bacterium]